MNERSTAADPGLVLAHVSILDALRTGGSDGAFRVAQQIFPFQLARRSRAATGQCPQAFLIAWSGVTMVYMLGAETVALSQGFIDATRLPTRLRSAGFNEFAWEAVFQITQWINANSMSAPIMHFTGHSLGGLMAIRLAGTWDDVGNTNRVLTGIGFGVPRGQQFPDGVAMNNGSSLYRYNLPDDPIPHLPPTPSESPILYALNDRASGAAWRRTQHNSPGATLNPDFTQTNQDVPSGFPEITAADILQYYRQNSATGIPAHALETYATWFRGDPVARAGSAYDRVPGANPVIPIRATPVALPVQTPAERRIALADLAAATAARRGPEPERPPYYARKVAGLWGCYYQGNLIAGGGRRTCQSLARKLNAAWREWWVTKYGSGDELSSSISDAFPG